MLRVGKKVFAAYSHIQKHIGGSKPQHEVLPCHRKHFTVKFHTLNSLTYRQLGMQLELQDTIDKGFFHVQHNRNHYIMLMNNNSSPMNCQRIY